MDAHERTNPAALSPRQRRMFVRYWTITGAITGATKEPVLNFLKQGVWRFEPLSMAFGSIQMAVVAGGAFWLLYKTERPQPEATTGQQAEVPR